MKCQPRRKRDNTNRVYTVCMWLQRHIVPTLEHKKLAGSSKTLSLSIEMSTT